ncbi:aldehyde dehydrogenase family protein [uncultured Erythrobacter sp.]|uniref:aldehyde dehydrogenase family protein n=1 Tax=uncultured Erythrobacter sp. TaxID=263913 RepID=UPI00260DC8DA|nr:aldehyde dehydrogenase family protein [uncultured Erythrobacter sp.]
MSSEATSLPAVGSTLVMSDGSLEVVTAEMVEALATGSRLLAVGSGDGQNHVLLIAPEEAKAADTAVSNAFEAFSAMSQVRDAAILKFFELAASRLRDDTVWQAICEANAADVERALAKGRTVGRLKVNDKARQAMIDGLDEWHGLGVFRNSVIETVERDGFTVDLIRAPLGVVGFVFEGRPNVVVDACGVLLTGNSVVFRIGSDAIGTARTILAQVVEPALQEAGMPQGAVSLVDHTSHGAGWALFSDDRLGLAVARGSGEAVAMLGAIARQSGVPVSLHGRGGAWMFVGDDAVEERIAPVVARSLDRKVCNTLNTLCVPRANLDAALAALVTASEQIVQSYPDGMIVHAGAETLPQVQSLAGVQAIDLVPLGEANLGTEWEWDDCPEITIEVIDTLADGYALLNTFSPRFVATLLSDNAAEHERFFNAVECPFVGDDHTRWVDGQFALGKPELGLSNWENGRLLGRSGILAGDSVFTVRMRYRKA